MAKNINVILSLQDRFTSKMSLASYETLQFKRNLALAQVASDKMATVMHKMETMAVAGVTVAATATVAAVKSSLSAYQEFNESMNNVAGVKGIETINKATGEVSESFKDLIDMAKNASKEVAGTTYKDAADTLYYMSLAGWDTAQSQKALVPALKAVRISGQDTKTVADALTDSMTALGLSAGQAADYVDVATAVQSASNTDMLQLQNALIKSGAGMESLYSRYADTMGEAAGKMQAAKETMAIVGALSSAGIKDSQAGTVVNSLFTRFVKDSAEAQDGLEQIGLSMYDNNGQLKATNEIFEEMSEKVASLNEQERNSALSKIGGRFRSQLETLINAFNEVGEDGQTAISKINKAMEYSEGAADKYIDAINSGWSGKIAEMSASWFNFKSEVGEIVAPYAIEGMDYIIDKLPTIEEWLKTNLPTALEKGKEIVLEIKDILEWIAEHWKQIVTVAGTAYVGMGAFRLGTAGVTAYDTINKIGKGINKQSVAKAAAIANVPGLGINDLTSVVGNNSNGIVANGISEYIPKITDEVVDVIPEGAIPINVGTSIVPSAVQTVGGLTESAGVATGAAEAAGLGAAATAGTAEAATAVTAATGAAGSAGGLSGALAGLAAPAAIIVAIVASLVLAYKNSEKFRESISNLVGTVKDKGLKAFERIKDSIGKAKEAAQPFFDVCGDIFGVLGDVAAIAVNVLSPFVGAAMDLIGMGLEGIIEGIGTAFGLVGDAIQKICDTPLVQFLWDCIDYLADLSEEFSQFIGLITDDEPSTVGEYVPIAATGDHGSKSGTALSQSSANSGGGVSDEEQGGEGNQSSAIKWTKNAKGEWVASYETNSLINSDENYKNLSQGGKKVIAASDVFSNKEKAEIIGSEYTDAIKKSDEFQAAASAALGNSNSNASIEYKLFGNALGTSYWKGGITQVNERGGEIMDLPKGTRIIPADKSEKMVNAVNKGVTVIVQIENFYGEDEAYINRIGNVVGHKLARVL